MSLEDYKKAVEKNLLKLLHGNTTAVKESLACRTESDWQDYMKDFSPWVAAAGIVSGLI